MRLHAGRPGRTGIDPSDEIISHGSGTIHTGPVLQVATEIDERCCLVRLGDDRGSGLRYPPVLELNAA